MYNLGHLGCNLELTLKFHLKITKFRSNYFFEPTDNRVRYMFTECVDSAPYVMGYGAAPLPVGWLLSSWLISVCFNTPVCICIIFINNSSTY